MNRLDMNKDGKIEFDEFSRYLMPKYKNSGLDESLGYENKIAFQSNKNDKFKSHIWDLINSSLKVEEKIESTIKNQEKFEKDIQFHIIKWFNVSQNNTITINK